MSQQISPVVFPIDLVSGTWKNAKARDENRKFTAIYNDTAAHNVYAAFGDSAPPDITTAILIGPGDHYESNVLELITATIWLITPTAGNITTSTATTDGADSVKVMVG